MKGGGFLAIWSDLSPEDETDWAHWMMREHSLERLRVDGFLACRVFRALGRSPNRYLILYELESASAVGGPSYLARLNAPTPWSQRVMPKLGNFARGGGAIAASSGIGQGSTLAAFRLDAVPEGGAALCRDLAGQDRIAAARLLVTDQAQTGIQTKEKGLRHADDSFAALLLVEGLDEVSVRNAAGRVPAFGAEAPLYTACFNLDRRLLPSPAL